ncbi:hypothetical protein [Deinococcus roseus]|uniref:Uncharacterized protein n=1 Tax=Deinococcus roseus TaxID=392414 RepID=A0ABQ2DA74_9DEIO|nr:hypothetical protein [Deinococcus roseus]GGJ51059.1 hypothetical protein GCM10008938_41330 [Deinococcus roseus]
MMQALRFALLCAVLGAFAAWLGMMWFPTQAGFIASRSARQLVLWTAAAVPGLLGGLWHLSGERKSSPLEGMLLALLGVFLVGMVSLLFWWGPQPYTLQTGWMLSWDMLQKTWWVLLPVGLGLHFLKRVL